MGVAVTFHDAPGAAFDLDAWIASSTAAQRTVILTSDPAIPARLARLDARAARANRSRRPLIDAEYERLWKAWQTSKETWVLRELSWAESIALRAAHPDVSTDESRGAADLHLLTLMIASRTTAAGTQAAESETLTADGILNPNYRPAVDVDQLKALRARPGRQNDITILLKAAADLLAYDYCASESALRANRAVRCASKRAGA